MAGHRKLFVNLPVRDLAASKGFFARLGFRFHARYTDELAACMIVSEGACVILLTEAFFARFCPKPRCDARSAAEVCLTLSCRSRGEVAVLLAEALRAGGALVAAPLDCGFVCAASFRDLDGHHWEVRWMDPHPVLA